MNGSKLFVNLYNYRLFYNSKTIKTVSSSQELIEKATSNYDDNEELLLKQREHEIELKRNKSRLLPQHRNMLREEVPYSEPQSWIHETVKYQRKMYGRYGQKSGVQPGICWPTKTDLEEIQEYEKVAYPFTIPDMMRSNKQKNDELKAAQDARQAEIVKKMSKLEQWKKELSDRIAKREADALRAKERKDRLVEEVRRHFGYTVNPKDEKFQEMLEKKDKEDKKSQKEAKRKAREEIVIARLQQKHMQEGPESAKTQGNKEDTSL